MIDWLTNWLKEIILIVLLASFVDLLLPNSNMQKYARLILGLLIILTIISPIFELFTENFSVSTFVKGIETEAYSYESNTDTTNLIGSKEYESKMVEQVEQSMMLELKGLLETKYAISIIDLELTANLVNNSWEIKKIILMIEEGRMEDNPSTSNEVAVIEEITEVEQVEININQQEVTEANNNESSDEHLANALKEEIHKEWGFPEEMIFIEILRSSN